jgi:DNA-binding beta-propeller fold protein YncE
MEKKLMIRIGKRSFVSIIVGILNLSTVLKNLKVARTLAMGVVAALVIAGMAGSSGAAPYASIMNSQSSTVSETDTASNTVTVNVGSYPVGVEVNPAITRVYMNIITDQNIGFCMKG